MQNLRQSQKDVIADKEYALFMIEFVRQAYILNNKSRIFIKFF